MKKRNFMLLVLGAVATLVFGVGICMCLIPEWDLRSQGTWVTAAGGALLLVLMALSLKGKKRGSINWKFVGKVAYGTVSALVLGVGMSMIMVWQMMLPGIAVGIAGIVMLLGLIPMCLGLK